MADKIKIISWNVNGIRAAVKKGFTGFLKEQKPDILCLQEVKISNSARDKETFDFQNYQEFWNSAERPGYAGTAILIKEDFFKKNKILQQQNGIGKKEFDNEGRTQSLELEKFCIINSYFPNSRHDLSRLGFKIKFNEQIQKFSKKMTKNKPVILAGDFNVAHEEIDLANPKENEGGAGFHIKERVWMTGFLKSGFVDTFRIFYPKKTQYTWWSYKFRARQRNIGWRVDYICASNKIKNNISSSFILDKIHGSDHCPIGIEIQI
jgi:exodeoxyribonuclease-3